VEKKVILEKNQFLLSVLCFLVVAGLLADLSCGNARYRLNEESAALSMKSIRSAERKFFTTDGKGRYGTLGELGIAGLIDSKLATGIKDGYQFEIRVEGASFKATAIPVEYDRTGSWSFYMNESGVLRGTSRSGNSANSQDPPVRYQ